MEKTNLLNLFLVVLNKINLAQVGAQERYKKINEKKIGKNILKIINEGLKGCEGLTYLP